jgi:hypothetical protein
MRRPWVNVSVKREQDLVPPGWSSHITVDRRLVYVGETQRTLKPIRWIHKSDG